MTKLIYVYDALCGWCYGFSPVIRKLYDVYHETVEFEVVSGGMILHENAGVLSKEKAEYIINTIPRVEEFTGVKFGEAYKEKLRSGTMFQSSMKPAIALAIFRTYHPKEVVNFAAAIQTANFRDGKDLEEDQTYLELIATTDIDANIFQKQLHNDEFSYAAQQEFHYAGELGITGFPALLAEHNDQYYLLSRGYQSYDSLQPVIKKILAL